MTENVQMQSEIAQYLTSLFPPSIQGSLLERRNFVEATGIEVDAKITLGTSGLSFKRSDFYNALRKVVNGIDNSSALTSDGVLCSIAVVSHDSETHILLNTETDSYALELPWAFYEDADRRTEMFSTEIRRCELNEDDVIFWREILHARPLTDGEYDDFKSCLRRAPRNVFAAIRQELKSGTIELSALMPNDMRYYEHLVGRIGDAGNLGEFISASGATHLGELLSRGCEEGLARAVVACPQAALSALLSLERFEIKEIEDFYDWILEKGDRFSQVAAVEVGFAHIAKLPSLEPLIERIIEEIRNDDSQAFSGRLSLLSNLIVLLDGYISRNGLFREMPPFWRRLAVIAQASIIERVFVDLGPSDFDYKEWTGFGRGQTFVLQNLVDLRQEPRWLPDFISPDQLKLEFLCRIRNAGFKFKDSIRSKQLKELVCGESIVSLRQQLIISLAFLPGPLEGGEPSPNPLPDELLEQLRSIPDNMIPRESTFAGLINAAFIFSLDAEHAELAATALRNAKYRLDLEGGPEITFALLAGLASVAAVTRGMDLGEEVRLLTRAITARSDLNIDAENHMRIGLIASAAYADLDGWCESVGRWFSDISFGEISPDVARVLRSHLRILCHLVPQLWRTCSKADAALMAIPS